MKAEGAVKLINFSCTEASPGETPDDTVPKCLNRWHFALTSTFLECTPTPPCSERHVSTTLQETVDYHTYKIFQDLFPWQEKRDNMLLEES